MCTSTVKKSRKSSKRRILDSNLSTKEKLSLKLRDLRPNPKKFSQLFHSTRNPKTGASNLRPRASTQPQHSKCREVPLLISTIKSCQKREGVIKMWAIPPSCRSHQTSTTSTLTMTRTILNLSFSSPQSSTNRSSLLPMRKSWRRMKSSQTRNQRMKMLRCSSDLIML